MLQVREDNQGFKDLFYTGSEPIAAGQVVYTLSGPTLTHPTRTSIQVDATHHVEDALGQFVNHHCTPSVKVVGHQLVALRDIHCGDSITFDYNATEDDMSDPFKCSCCDRWIAGGQRK